MKGEIERATGIIAGYRKGIDFYREMIDKYHESLGRIAERLGEPEDKGED